MRAFRPAEARHQVEASRLAKADDENALAVLRHEVGAVDDAGMDVVAEVFDQRAADDVEGAALVVRDEVLDVFQQEGARPLGLDDAAMSKNSVPCVSQAKPCARPSAFFLVTPAIENG